MKKEAHAMTTVKREFAAAQRRAEKVWNDLEKRRTRKLQEVTEIERQLEALHPVMQSLFAAAA
jgi:hypothetical protein